MKRYAWIAPGLSILFLALLVSACAQQQMRTGERSRSDDLVATDLRDFGSVFDAVQNLRPQWLRERTGTYLANNRPDIATKPANPVWVYWDGTRLGDPSSMRRISPDQVESLRYFDARMASVRWGINHENGVIYITPAVGSVGPGMR